MFRYLHINVKMELDSNDYQKLLKKLLRQQKQYTVDTENQKMTEDEPCCAMEGVLQELIEAKLGKCTGHSKITPEM